MRYTQLGRSGLTVSRLALGTMTFGQYLFSTFQANVDQAAADRMVGLALDAGVNLFDTAEGYGQGRSEETLGRAIRHAGARDRAIIATKVSTFGTDSKEESPDLLRLSYRHLVGNVEAALRRLGTDWIDLYQLHAPDFVTPWEETLRALDDLVGPGPGPLRRLEQLPGLARRARPGHPAATRVRAVRLRADLLFADRPRGRARGAAVLSSRRAGHPDLEPARRWFPHRQIHPRRPDGRRRSPAAFSVPPIDVDRAYQAVDTMREIAGHHRAPIAHIAYAWLLAKAEVSSVIIGASRPEQLADNLAAELTLTDDELAVLDALDPPPPLYPDPRWLVPNT